MHKLRSGGEEDPVGQNWGRTVALAGSSRAAGIGRNMSVHLGGHVRLCLIYVYIELFVLVITRKKRGRGERRSSRVVGVSCSSLIRKYRKGRIYVVKTLRPRSQLRFGHKNDPNTRFRGSSLPLVRMQPDVVHGSKINH